MPRTETKPSLAKARRMIAAIDTRIDRVREQLPPVADEMSCYDWQRAWDSVPGLQGIERSLFRRRGQWAIIRDEHEYRLAQAAEERERRRFVAEQRAKARERCACCGRVYEAA